MAAPEVFRISPRAAKLARESAIDPTPIVGTGPSGRIVERDVKKYLEAKGYDRLRITPAAKRLAAKENRYPEPGRQERSGDASPWRRSKAPSRSGPSP